MPDPFTLALDVRLADRHRLSVVLRPLYAFIAAFYAAFFAAVGGMTAGFAWIALVITGRYPVALYDFNVQVVRVLVRFHSYLLLIHDVAPPLDGDPDDAYPCRVHVPPPRAAYDRKAVLLRPFLAIPILLRDAFASAVGSCYAVVGTLCILFTGELPASFAAPLRAAVVGVAHGYAYLVLMIDEPPALLPGDAPAPALGPG